MKVKSQSEGSVSVLLEVPMMSVMRVERSLADGVSVDNYTSRLFHGLGHSKSHQAHRTSQLIAGSPTQLMHVSTFPMARRRERRVHRGDEKFFLQSNQQIREC